MKIESEKRLEAKTGEMVRSLGGISIKLGGILGIPDRICLFKGARVCITEIKTTGQKPRKIQLTRIDQLRGLGFDVRIIDRTEHINQLREDYEDRSDNNAK